MKKIVGFFVFSLLALVSYGQTHITHILESTNAPIALKLIWDASPSPNIIKYSIYESQNTNSFVLLGSTTNLFFPVNVNYGTYKWRATAHNAYAESDPAELVFQLVALTNNVPGAPTNFVLVKAENLIKNGSFENNLNLWLTNGNVAIGGRSTEGTNCVAFNPSQSSPNGSIEQTIQTISNTKYVLLFDLGTVSWNKQGVQSLNVWINTNINKINLTNNSASGEQKYMPQLFSFIANNTNTTIRFQDVSNLSFNIDLLLDNVRVYQQLVP